MCDFIQIYLNSFYKMNQSQTEGNICCNLAHMASMDASTLDNI